MTNLSPVLREEEVFSALASSTRRELLRLLREEGQLPVQQLAAHFPVRRPSISEHLLVLRQAGLVSERREGRQRYYRLEALPLKVLEEWLGPYKKFWGDKLENLRQVLEEENLHE